MSLSAACALATLLSWAPASAPPPPREAVRGEVLRLLARPDDLPREQDWLPLGPDALPELLGLVSDASLPEPRRLRAVAALAVVAPDAAAHGLQALAHDPSAALSVRAAAMNALGRRAGLAAIPLLRPLLDTPDDAVRASAAQALGHVGGGEAREALEGRLTREEKPEVREALQQALSYLEP